MGSRAEERLRKAALELYAAHGYDAVTVNQIAEHAGLTRRSYFRYFPDKREVLFAGSERLALRPPSSRRSGLSIRPSPRGRPRSKRPRRSVSY